MGLKKKGGLFLCKKQDFIVLPMFGNTHIVFSFFLHIQHWQFLAPHSKILVFPIGFLGTATTSSELQFIYKQLTHIVLIKEILLQDPSQSHNA